MNITDDDEMREDDDDGGLDIEYFEKLWRQTAHGQTGTAVTFASYISLN